MTYTWNPPKGDGCLDMMLTLVFAPFLLLGRGFAMRKHWTWMG